MKLSNHLPDVHQLSAVERKYYLSGASDPEKPGDMSSRKRMRSDSEDDMSTVARDEESEEEMSSPKRIRSESDDETSTVSNKDIFSSSDDDKSSEETDDTSNEGEISEETQRRNFIQSTVNLCKVLKMMDLAKLTRRNKPLRLFYQSFERNWEMFIWIVCNGCRNWKGILYIEK